MKGLYKKRLSAVFLTGVLTLAAVGIQPMNPPGSAAQTDGRDIMLRLVEPVSLRDVTAEVTDSDRRKRTGNEAGYPWSNETYLYRQWYLDDVYAQDAWKSIEDRGRHPGSDVVVAVLDTGVDITHPDLAGNIWINTAEEHGITGVDDDGNGYVDDIYGGNIVSPGATMSDSHGHGTQMAGIIAMAAGNEIGGAGISYGVKVMPVRVTAGSEFSVLAALKGLQYAMDNGADIISMSFSSTIPSTELEQAMNTVANRCITVAAAGNNGADMSTPCYPAAYDSVTGVMSYGKSGIISTFSDWDSNPGSGAEYEIAAPGEEIFATNRARTFAEGSGTSHATAVVSGAMAVSLAELRAAGLNPRPEEFKAYFLANLTHTTTPDYAHGYRTFKRLNLVDVVTNITSGFHTIVPRPTVPATPTPAPAAATATSPTPARTSSGIPTVPPLPTSVPLPDVTLPPTATDVPVETTAPVATAQPSYVVREGTILRAGSNGKKAFYRVTDVTRKSVIYYNCNVKKTRKNAQIPATVTLPDGNIYRVMGIRQYCFANRKRVKRVTVYATPITRQMMKQAILGSHVKKIVYKN